MPRMDGTGPMGQGPMTGRGFGVCDDDKLDRSEKSGCGLGPCGRGLANRRGFSRGNRGHNRKRRG
jgi:hypothetical protein